MLRERKIVLFVMGDEEILERSRMVVSQLALQALCLDTYPLQKDMYHPNYKRKGLHRYFSFLL